MDDFEYIWYVDEETWNWLQDLLNEEPKVLPKLRELMSRKSIFDAVSEEYRREQEEEDGDEGLV